MQNHLHRLKTRLSEFASAPPPASEFASAPPPASHRATDSPISTMTLDRFHKSTKDRPLKKKTKKCLPSVEELSRMHDANTTNPPPPPCKDFKRERARTAHHTAWNFLVSAYRYPPESFLTHLGTMKRRTVLRQCQQATGVTLACVRHYLYGDEKRFTWEQAASAANQGPFVEQLIHKMDCRSQEYMDIVRDASVCMSHRQVYASSLTFYPLPRAPLTPSPSHRAGAAATRATPAAALPAAEAPASAGSGRLPAARAPAPASVASRRLRLPPAQAAAQVVPPSQAPAASLRPRPALLPATLKVCQALRGAALRGAPGANPGGARLVKHPAMPACRGPGPPGRGQD